MLFYTFQFLHFDLKKYSFCHISFISADVVLHIHPIMISTQGKFSCTEAKMPTHVNVLAYSFAGAPTFCDCSSLPLLPPRGDAKLKCCTVANIADSLQCLGTVQYNINCCMIHCFEVRKKCTKNSCFTVGLNLTQEYDNVDLAGV